MDFLIEKEADGIYTRHAREEDVDGVGYTMHIHDRCEIFYFIKGDADYLIEGSEYSLVPGSLLVIRPGEVHRTRLNSRGLYERYAINFPLDIFDSIDPENRIIKPFTDRSLGKHNLYYRPEYKKLFEEICEITEDDYERRIRVYSALLQIITDIGKEFSESKKEKAGKDRPLSVRIIEYINDHLSEELSIPAISEKFYISDSKLSRIFKQYIGASPWEYILAKRLITAKDLIDKGASAGEAADKCGFKDYSSFYRAYIKRFGCSPKKST
jgi:AraC-like DNA-binding protein